MRGPPTAPSSSPSRVAALRTCALGRAPSGPASAPPLHRKPSIRLASSRPKTVAPLPSSSQHSYPLMEKPTLPLLSPRINPDVEPWSRLPLPRARPSPLLSLPCSTPLGPCAPPAEAPTLAGALHVAPRPLLVVVAPYPSPAMPCSTPTDPSFFDFIPVEGPVSKVEDDINFVFQNHV